MNPHPLPVTITRFSTTFTRLAFQSIVVPLYLLSYVSEQSKGSHLGIISGLGALLYLCSFLIAGPLSDSISTRLGRRRPFIILGTFFASLSLFTLSLADNYISLVLSFLVLILSIGIIDTASIALLPDVIPERQRGKASAYYIFFQTTGAALGPAMAGLFLNMKFSFLSRLIFFKQLPLEGNPLFVFSLVIIILLTSTALITCAGVKEKILPLHPFNIRETVRNAFSLTFLRARNYFIFVFFRFIMMLSVATLGVFLLYFAKDFLQLENYTLQTSLMFLIFALGSIVSLVLSGYSFDRYHKKYPLILSGTIIVFSILLFWIMGRISLTAVYVSIFLYGIGFGGFFTAATALATLLIPDQNKTGQYMGFTMVTTIIAYLFASVVCGLLLDFFNSIVSNGGYISLIIFMEICSVIGTLGMVRSAIVYEKGSQ